MTQKNFEIVVGDIIVDNLTYRDWKLISMRQEGYSLREICDELGITRERVRQIIKRHLGTSKVEVTNDMRDDLLNDNEILLKDISELIGVSESYLHSLVFQRKFPKPLRKTKKFDGLRTIEVVVFDKEEVMTWCKKRHQEVKEVLLKRLQRCCDLEQLHFIQIPFEKMQWKGNLKLNRTKPYDT